MVAWQLEQPVPERVRIFRFVMVAGHHLKHKVGQLRRGAVKKQLPALHAAGVVRGITRIAQIAGGKHEIRIGPHHGLRHLFGCFHVDPALQVIVQRKGKRRGLVGRRRPKTPFRLIAVPRSQPVAVVRPRLQIPQREHMTPHRLLLGHMLPDRAVR